MNWGEYLETSLSDYLKLREEFDELQKKWDEAPAGSEEESIITQQKNKTYDDLQDHKRDLDYMTDKVLREKGIDFLTPYVNYQFSAIDVTFDQLKDCIAETDLFIKMHPESKMIKILIEKDNEKLFSDFVIVFAIEDMWLKSASYLIDCDIKDEDVKNDIIINHLNQYNETTRAMKAYIDRDGTLALERQDIISQGMTRGSLLKLIDLVIRTVVTFHTGNNELIKAIYESYHV